MPIELFLDNLLSPPVLFFALGLAATLVRSDLEIPPPVAKLLSLYLLWAIGFKGGLALREAGLDASVLTPIVAAVALSAVVPLVAFPLLRPKFGLDDASALAACFGSVSVVTFVTAADFLSAREIDYGGEMVAALALMESPAIIVALTLRQWLIGRQRRAANGGTRRSEGPGIPTLLREAITSGPVFLLLGSLTIGLVVGPESATSLKPFTYDIFQGVLVLFLLEAGLVAGQRIRELRQAGLVAISFGVVIPLMNAGIGLVLARIMGLSPGNALLFTILAASASYIAVPAVVRLAVPRANPGIYLPMSLGITFPFNVCVGIPLYLSIIEATWPAS